jgi:hypothetical protein
VLKSALRVRLAQHAASQDYGLVHSSDAISEAADLLAASNDLLADTQAIALVGQLHFLRWMGDQDDAEELQIACMLLAPLLRRRPGLLPKPVRAFLTRERRRREEPGGHPAKTALQRALTGKETDAFAWAELLWQLSTVLNDRFERTGQTGTLSEAIAVLRHALAATPSGAPEYFARLASLGICLRAWYRETARPDELHEALRSLHAALANTSDSRVRQTFILPALGSALHDLFDLTGDLNALDDGINAHREAVRGLPPDHAAYGRRAANLAGVLLVRFRRTGELATMNEAIDYLRGAKTAAERHAEQDSRVLAALCSNLSVALRERFERTHSPVDLDEAIEQARQAVSYSVVPSARSAAHGTLGAALMARCMSSGPAFPQRVVFAREAVAQLREAVATAPPDDPHLAATLLNLGNALLLTGDDARNLRPGAEAAETFRLAARNELAPPRIRAEANVAAGRVAADCHDWQRATSHFADAIGLLEQAIPRGLRRDDQEHQLKRLRDLASDACACAWLGGDTARAAALFEQGRGVLLAQAMGDRQDLAQLGDLAEPFSKLSRDMEALAASGVPAAFDEVRDWTVPTIAEERRRLVGEWEKVIAQIRDRVSGFMLPPPTADLIAAAREGPIVLVNASRYGSAAFLLHEGTVEAVPLPELRPQVVRAMVAELLTALDTDEHPRDRDRRLTGLLGWLWDVIAGPVLDHLGFDQPLAQEPAGPRLWWCPAGLLSFLPLHAAGYHRTRSDPVPRTVMDRTISSYLPTVRVLMHARRATGRVAAAGHAARGTVVVVVPDPTGLPGTAKEAAMLGTASSVEVLAGPNATRSAVLSALERSRCVHFACHAHSNLEDPSASYVALRDHLVRPLTVADVASLRLTDARLAFLSACSTYQGGLTLADEAIHLGSAFQLAGYRHVIATLWPTLDSPPTVRITQRVYRGVDGPTGLNGTASALHTATRDERDRVPDAPSVWAAHIHCGS